MIDIRPQDIPNLVKGLRDRVLLLCDEGKDEASAITHVLNASESIQKQSAEDRGIIERDLIALLRNPPRKPVIRHRRHSTSEFLRELGEVKTENRHDATHPPLHHAS